jgi:thiol-disulfide isomerase/thioredoxin
MLENKITEVNMKKILIMLIVISSIIYSQTNFKKMIDEKSGKEMIVGQCDFTAFADSNYSWWFEYGEKNYSPDSIVVQKLKEIVDKPEVTIVMGTWCSDSKREVPRFYKIMKEINYDEKKIKLICVDRKKEAPDYDVASLEIKLVPTFIFYKDGKEIGRIIETPTKKLEEDILEIFMK